MDDLTEEQQLIRERERASRASDLLSNPLLKEAFEQIEKEILSAKEATHDQEHVMKLHTMFVCNRKLQNTLRGFVETGKLAGLQLEQKRKFRLFGVN